MNKYGRLPNLDEIPNVDSSQHIINKLHLDSNSSTSIDNIISSTNTSSIEEANVSLNDTYKDKDINIIPLYKEALVDIKDRPSEYKTIEQEKHQVDRNPNMQGVFNQLFNKLERQYGVRLHTISDKELASDEWQGIPEIQAANAFIYNGDVYINTDHARADAPIHEMTHMLLGSIRFKNPDLYYGIVQQAQNFPTFNQFMEQNPNRAINDNMEELFVTEMSKYLAGESSIIEQLDEHTINELHYNMKRLLDTALMGQYSVKSIPDSKLYRMSLADLVETVNSQMLETSFYGSLDDAALHRVLANTKSDLMKKGDLREDCV